LTPVILRAATVILRAAVASFDPKDLVVADTRTFASEGHDNAGSG
jgi:hypothetical protein